MSATFFLWWDLGRFLNLFAAALFLYILLRYPVSRFLRIALSCRTRCLPPPKVKSFDPFFGIDVLSRLQTAVKRHKFLDTVSQIFIDTKSWTVELNQAGTGVLWTADPENIKTILSTNAEDWRIGISSKEFMDPVFGPNVVTADGKHWHESRQIIQPAFRRAQSGALDLTKRHVDNFMARLPRDGKAVDLKPLFYMLTMDILTEFLIGISLGSLMSTDDSDAAAFAKAFDLLRDTVTKAHFVGNFGVLANIILPDIGLQEATALLTQTLDNCVATATGKLVSGSEKKGEADGYSVMEEMLRTWPTQPERVRNEILPLLFSGRDSTSSALSNLFHALSRHPDVWGKIRAECLAAPEHPSAEELEELRYLQDCVRESLRVVNPTIDMSRTAAVDTILPRGGGKYGTSPMLVKKGTNCDLWIYALHHRKDVWGEDADVFRPERWAESQIMPWSYIPFGTSARACPGQQLALTEILYTVFRMAREFDQLDTLDQEPWTESLSIGTSSLHGNHVQLQR